MSGSPATADDLPKTANALRDMALEAGAAIMKIYENDITVRHKDDKSPVTDADEAAEKIILAGLARLTPEIPVVAEESVTAVGAPKITGSRFWLVDPLDGTKEFISRNGEFTVNIALIENNSPTIGVVYAPAAGRLFIAASPDQAFGQEKQKNGSWGPLHKIEVRPAPPALVAVASRSHRDAKTDAFLAKLTIGDLRSAGSSLKFCLIAAGEADIYPRFGPTMEWDTAAGHAVLAAAGGSVRTPDDKPFLYGKPDFRNGHFIAYGKTLPK